MQNRVTLIGNLGADVRMTTLDSGKKVAKMKIATHEYHKDVNGNYKQITQWHNVVGWDAKAEFMSKLLERGSYVVVYGRLVHRSFEDKEGVTRYVSEIVLREFDTPRTNMR